MTTRRCCATGPHLESHHQGTGKHHRDANSAAEKAAFIASQSR